VRRGAGREPGDGGRHAPVQGSDAALMRLLRIFTGGGHLTHFADIEVPLTDAGDISWLSATVPATGVAFRETPPPPDYDFDRYPAPRRQYIVLLGGGIEIVVCDGTTQRGESARTAFRVVRRRSAVGA
jgi:hypothetical protein